MPSAVIDADVVSFEFKKDSRARLYRPHLLGRQGIIAFMTVAELANGQSNAGGDKPAGNGWSGT